VGIEHPLLERIGVRHAFGLRDDEPPHGLLQPVQVHGAEVVWAEVWGGFRPEADAIVASAPIEAPIAVVTADCVPLLASSPDGSAVAAIHAGWRGLAAGVIEAGIAALREAGGEVGAAAIGPHIGPCCYEVDAPVKRALAPRFDAELEAALRPTRPDHWRLDLARLARAALLRAGVAEAAIGSLEDDCTFCHERRFHSHRRDGPRSGRLTHWIARHG